MTERDALLATIRAHPDDDTPRLMFADWLDEHEPDAKPRKGKGAASPSSWAALIRAECEFERLRNDGSAAAAVFSFFDSEDKNTFAGVRWQRALPEMVRRVELRRTFTALRRRSAAARKAGLPRVGNSGSWQSETHRGFPAEFDGTSGASLLRYLPNLLASTPPVHLATPLFELPEAENLVAAGLGRWCRALTAPAADGGARLIAALARSPDAAGVHELTIGWGDHGRLPEILEAVADSPYFSLRALEFEVADRVLPDLLCRLLPSRALRGLTRLTIRNGNWTRECVAALGNLTELRELWLPHGNIDVGLVAPAGSIDDALAEQLADLPGLSNLRLLNLVYNRIGGRGVSALLASPHLKNLATLHLEGNPFRDLDRAALAAAPAGGLRALNLQYGRLKVADLVAVVSSPRASELMYFACCGNRLPESAVAKMVKGFGDRAPAVLCMMDNNIVTAGAEALANWPAAERIDMLHLVENTLSVAGAKAIACCPHLKQLNHICVAVTKPAGRDALKKRFGDHAQV